jgi:predicted protein tyrosine phosphatase
MERSPTAEILFKDVPGWITKSAGTSINAIQNVTMDLIDWADNIIVMESRHYETIIKMAPDTSSKVVVLGIEDQYYRCSPQLVGRLILEMSKRFSLNEWIKTKFKC